MYVLIHWTTNSYHTVCVLIQAAQKTKVKEKLNKMQKNPCAQKNEILVHKGHKHENNNKLCVF